MKKIALLILLFFTASCWKVGPDFEVPCAPMQDAFSVESSEQELEGAWWEKLSDARLNKLVTKALEQNFSLTTAAWRVIEARYELGIAEGLLFPQEQQAVGELQRVGRSKNAPSTLFADLYFTTYQLGFSAAWELDFWGRFRRGVEGAKEQLFATYAGLEDVQNIVVAEVASAYTAYCTIGRRIAILEQNVEKQERSLQIADARWQAGLVTELDVSQACALLESTRARLPQLRTEQTLTLNALGVLLGVTPEEVLSFVPNSCVIPEAKGVIEAGVPCAFVMRRPDLRRALSEAAAQSAQIGIATSELYPHLFVSGMIGTQTSSGSSTTLRGGGALFSGSSFTYILGPSFAWNLWNYGRIRSAIGAEYARFYQLVSRYQEAVLRAYQDVENGLMRYREAKKQTMLLAKSVHAAERASDLANAQYVEGVQDYTRVLDTQVALLNQQEALVVSEGAVTQGFIASYRALGYGIPRIETQPSE